MSAAAEADEADPLRVVYWSADYLDREAERLEKEYVRLLETIQLRNPKLRRCARQPRARHAQRPAS